MGLAEVWLLVLLFMVRIAVLKRILRLYEYQDNNKAGKYQLIHVMNLEKSTRFGRMLMSKCGNGKDSENGSASSPELA